MRSLVEWRKYGSHFFPGWLYVVLKNWIILPTVHNEFFWNTQDSKGYVRWINFISILRNDCCITSIAIPKYLSLMIISNYLKSNKKVLIAEKRRSKNKRALEVQRLPNKPYSRFYHCEHYVKIHDFSFSHSCHIFSRY